MKQLLIFASIGLCLTSTCIAQAPASSPEIDADKRDSAEVLQTSALDELSWMVGKWLDQGDDATITTDCSWTHNGKFLSRSFKFTTSGEVTLEGTQVIGWDPIEGQIRSWTFDSEGGFGTGRWIRDGDRWLVKTSFVRANGDRASAINVIAYVDQDTLRWQSTNREIAGELQPNIPEVTVIRQKTEDTESGQSEKEDSQ